MNGNRPSAEKLCGEFIHTVLTPRGKYYWAACTQTACKLATDIAAPAKDQ